MSVYWNFAVMSTVLCLCEAPEPPNPNQQYGKMLHNIVNLNEKRIGAMENLFKLENHDVMKPLRDGEFIDQILPLKERILILPSNSDSARLPKEKTQLVKDVYSNKKNRFPKPLERNSRFRRPTPKLLSNVIFIDRISPFKSPVSKQTLKPRHVLDGWTNKGTYSNSNDEVSDIVRFQNDPIYQSIIRHPVGNKEDINSYNNEGKDVLEYDSDDYIRYESGDTAKDRTIELPDLISSKNDFDSLFDENVAAEEVDDDLEMINNLDLTPEEAYMLRKSWRGSCDRKARKVCRTACLAAVSNFCSSFSCRHGRKSLFKKECKRSCKDKFDSSSY